MYLLKIKPFYDVKLQFRRKYLPHETSEANLTVALKVGILKLDCGPEGRDLTIKLDCGPEGRDLTINI